MSRFTGELTITQLDVNCRIWRLEESLIYEVKYLGSGRVIKVPKGFETDGASIPRIFQSLLPIWDKYSRAAIIHDYLYYGLKTFNPHKEGLTRKQADYVFLEAMKVSKVNFITRYCLWTFVRIFGWVCIKYSTKLDISDK